LWHDTANNRWEGTADVERDPLTGARRRVKVRGRTKAECLGKLQQAQTDASEGITTRGTTTVGAWLDHWLTTAVAGRVGSENTAAMYKTTVDHHLKPALGRIKLDRLTAEQVDRFLAAKAADGLSRSYVGRMRTILTDALRHAERRGLVRRNAGALSVMPRMQASAERTSLTPDQVRALLKAAKGERLEALIVVGVAAGFRPGELTGLLWSDLDLDAEPPTLSVTGSMKRTAKGGVVRGEVKRSRAGLRTVALPRTAVAALRAHKARQAAERRQAGSQWSDHGLIFCSEAGTPLDPSNVRKRFAAIAEKAGLPGGFPYMLRHATVSLLIDGGHSIEEVADLLGDDPRTLYRHYRHRVQPVAAAGLGMEKVLKAPRRT
jgi:integrase